MKQLILPLVMSLASPVGAQERMDLDTCVGGWTAVMSQVSPTAEMPHTEVSDDGWCVISDLLLPVDSGSSAYIESVQWRAADTDRVFELGLPPRTFELVADGFSIRPQTGDPVYDYLLGLQASQTLSGFGVNLRWDGVQNAVIVEDAYFDFFEGNRIEATARFDGVDLTDMAAIQRSAGTAGLSDLRLAVEYDGWFEAIAAFPIGIALLQDGDVSPEAQVAALRQQAIEFVSQIPDDLMPTPSREDLSAFIDSLPEPRGKAQVQISGEPVIGMARMLGFSNVIDGASLLAALPVALDGVTMLFTWTPITGD